MQPPERSLRHPLLSQLTASSNPKIAAKTLGSILPLRHLEALTPVSEWWHRDGDLALSKLPIAASVGSPFLLECDGHPLHWLTLVHDGYATVKQGPKVHNLGSGDGVIVPGQPWSLLGQHSSTTCIGFDPMLMMTVARAMAPAKWIPPSPSQTPLRQVLPLPTQEDAICAALVKTIDYLLPVLHHGAQLGDGFLDGFLIFQQFYRFLAALVFEDLRLEQQADDSSSNSGDRRLDRVLDYITLHLDQPLPLSVLEAQSNYSRRSLHYAFQHRFGCSPMQWIRQQRMELAIHRLENPLPDDSVASIAEACGYRSQSRFRADFERAYGCKPSAVLRGRLPAIGSSNTSSEEP